ncbi:hypothetical protein [Calothrix rhizosoleniae]|uniref:hypothetical protein n=1 Tax=Calothrix rhizosoleniae TaxID=888997 RepID=UPI000B4A49EB|nr:hypothetical protein [Calothrix rhizosoleniae]
MTAFNPGTDGTLISTTYEAAFIEAAQRLQDAEAGTDVDNISVNYFTGDNTVQVNGTFPMTQSVGTNGQPSFGTTEFVTTTFANGGGDLKSTNLPNAVLELAQQLQIKEKAQTGAEDKVQVTYTTETGLIAIAAELNVAYSVNQTDGSTKITTSTYLD